MQPAPRVRRGNTRETVVLALRSVLPDWTIQTVIAEDKALRGSKTIVANQTGGGVNLRDGRWIIPIGVTVYAPTKDEAANAALDIEAHMTSERLFNRKEISEVDVDTPPSEISDGTDGLVPCYYASYDLTVWGTPFNPSTP